MELAAGLPLQAMLSIATTLVFIGTGTAAAASTSISYGNFTIPAAGVVIVVPLSSAAASTSTITGATIGGLAATLNVATSTGISGSSGVVSRMMPPGIHDITVTYGVNNSGTNTAVGVWLLRTFVKASPIGAGITLTSGTSSPTISSNNSGGGGIKVMGVMHANTNATTWTGATSARYDATQGSSRFSYAEMIQCGNGAAPASWSGSVVFAWAGAAWR